ncbi:hypothetical protein [Streptosporangium carneum]|uniref:Uncharacterized protein n=1 Tax=Streptosporangium carneum TaxID=47481 RepID=A0A9W6I8W9_9ACTN|nr:hypothetical protein [Streptosporangium carneum]GLK13144.1 hypothetical protein GCM10017600_65550 [Streptosporangium carneum]
MSHTRKTAKRGFAARPFTLWKEVAVAYLSPALTAGLGGLLSGQPELTMAAFTSIGATSAMVAAVIGAWLHRRGRPRRWTTSVPRPVLTVGFGVVAAVIAGVAGWFASSWLPSHTSVPDAWWLKRLQIDLPLSVGLAATIVTWRWRSKTSRQQR